MDGSVTCCPGLAADVRAGVQLRSAIDEISKFRIIFSKVGQPDASRPVESSEIAFHV